MTEDYQRCTRGQIHRDTPSSNDEDLEGCIQGPSDGPQICETLGPEGSGMLFCLTMSPGAQYHSESGKYRGHLVLEALFQKLTNKAITPHRATPGSVGYNVFIPTDFTLQFQEQRTIFTDIAINPPKGYYIQLMSK